MRLQSIQAFFAPLATPLAPAMLFANEIYHSMVMVDIPSWMALTVSGIAIVGIEFSGALMCYNAIEAWRQKQKSKMVLAILGALIYAGIVMAGIATAENERVRILSLTVLLTLVAYLAYAIYESLRKQEVKEDELSEKELAIMREKRLMKNAEVRELKAKVPSKILANPTKLNEQIQQKIEQTGFVAKCNLCGWEKVYDQQRQSINGKNGHMRVCQERNKDENRHDVGDG